MTDLIERGQSAIAKALGDDLENHMLRSRRVVASRAVVAEVFNWLAESIDSGPYIAHVQSTESERRAHWLAARRKEALGE